MENWKAIAYLLAFGQGLILSIALVVRGVRKHSANLFMGLILLVLVQELLNAWAMQVRYHSRPDAFHFWNFQSYLVLPVALWFFLRCATQAEFSFKRRYWVYFAPVLVEISIRWLWQLCWDISERPLPSLLDNPLWFFTTEILPIAGMVAVLVYFGVKMWATKTMGNYRFDARISLLFIFFVLLTALWIGGVILQLPVFGGIELLITICLFGLGYAGYMDPGFFALPALAARSAPALADPTDRQVEKPDFSRFDDRLSVDRLQRYFSDKQPYTQPGLSLEEVAGGLRLPARYISYLINTHCDTNFNGYVNRYRMADVLGKLTDPKEQHKTILALAFEAGFSSKSTFNQVFKQHTGQSPSQFLQSQKQVPTTADALPNPDNKS